MYGVPVLSSKSDLRSVAVIAAPYVWGACFEFEVWFTFCCRHRSTVCMGCLFWVRSLIYVLLPSSQHRMYGVPVLSSKSDLRSVAVIAAPYVWGACFEFEVWFYVLLLSSQHRMYGVPVLSSKSDLRSVAVIAAPYVWGACFEFEVWFTLAPYVWGACFEFEVWFTFCCCHRSTVCMGCLFWVRSLIYVLLLSSQHRMYGVPVLSSKSDLRSVAVIAAPYVWGACFEFEVWFTFCCCHRSTVCMGCLFWVRSLIYVLLLSSQHHM